MFTDASTTNEKVSVAGVSKRVSDGLAVFISGYFISIRRKHAQKYQIPLAPSQAYETWKLALDRKLQTMHYKEFRGGDTVYLDSSTNSSRG